MKPPNKVVQCFPCFPCWSVIWASCFVQPSPTPEFRVESVDQHPLNCNGRHTRTSNGHRIWYHTMKRVAYRQKGECRSLYSATNRRYRTAHGYLWRIKTSSCCVWCRAKVTGYSLLPPQHGCMSVHTGGDSHCSFTRHGGSLNCIANNESGRTLSHRQDQLLCPHQLVYVLYYGSGQKSSGILLKRMSGFALYFFIRAFKNVCIVTSFSFYYCGRQVYPFGVTQKGGRSTKSWFCSFLHVSSAVLAFISIAKRVGPSLFPRRYFQVEFGNLMSISFYTTYKQQ